MQENQHGVIVLTSVRVASGIKRLRQPKTEENNSRGKVSRFWFSLPKSSCTALET